MNNKIQFKHALNFKSNIYILYQLGNQWRLQSLYTNLWNTIWTTIINPISLPDLYQYISTVAWATACNIKYNTIKNVFKSTKWKGKCAVLVLGFFLLVMLLHWNGGCCWCKRYVLMSAIYRCVTTSVKWQH